MLKKMKRTKLVSGLREKMPESWRIHSGNIGRFLDYIIYRRLFQKKLLALFPALRYLFFGKSPVGKRILGIWNFNATPPSIGVFIEFQMRLMCMAYEHKAGKIDIAFIYDPAKVVVDEKKYSWANPSNFHYHFQEMYPLVNINPKLGSVFIFNSHQQFESFVLQNSGRYILHPTFFDYKNGSESRPNISYVRDFYLKHNFLPKFEFKKSTLNWARAFVKKYIDDKLMVIANIRFNFAYSPQRNSDLGAWESLFRHCSSKYPDVVFVVPGRDNETREIRQRIGELPNVIFSKDFHTNIEQDLALIELSVLYMATIFGPASLPLLTDHIPYVLTKYANPEPLYDFMWLKIGGHFPWQNIDIQHLIWDAQEKETAEVLIREFEHVFGRIDKERWKERVDLKDVTEKFLDWPFSS